MNLVDDWWLLWHWSFEKLHQKTGWSYTKHLRSYCGCCWQDCQRYPVLRSKVGWIRAGTGRHNKNIVSRCYLYLHLQSIRITLTLGTAPWKFETIQLQHLHNYSSNKNTIWIIRMDIQFRKINYSFKFQSILYNCIFSNRRSEVNHCDPTTKWIQKSIHYPA